MSNLESEQPAEDRLARAAGGLLRQGAEDLDADTVMRPRRARQARPPGLWRLYLSADCR